MRRIATIIAVILMAQMIFAQHYVGVGVSASSPFQLDQSDATKPLVGWGEGVTLRYEYRRGHFLLSIGAAVSGEHPRVSVADETFSARMKDTREPNGIEFDYLGHLKSRSDLSSSLWFHTPVMIGFETYPFYMMVGAQYSLFLTSWTHQTAQLAAAADYLGRYYDDYIDDMFTHGYHSYEPVSSKGQMKYKNDIRLLVELGGTLKIGQNKNGLDQLLRIGAFAEVGLLNALDKPSTPTKTNWDVSQYMNVTMHHVYSAADANAGTLRNVVVGVRATFLFPAGGQQNNDKNKHKHYKTKQKDKKYKCRCIGYPYGYNF